MAYPVIRKATTGAILVMRENDMVFQLVQGGEKREKIVKYL